MKMLINHIYTSLPSATVINDKLIDYLITDYN